MEKDQVRVKRHTGRDPHAPRQSLVAAALDGVFVGKKTNDTTEKEELKPLVWTSCGFGLFTLEESYEDAERCADVLPCSPWKQEGLSADQSGRAGVRRVIQATRQLVELRQVDVGEPD